MNENVERKTRDRRRGERLAASLRENLKRRKAQQRGRATREPPASGEEPSPDTTGEQV